MMTFRCFRWLAVALACANWAVPSHRLWAAQPAQPRPLPVRSASLAPIDIALDTGGRLLGQVVDATGRPAARQVVSVRGIPGGTPRHVTTDARGQFVVDGLPGGVFQVGSDNATAVCRCWTASAAPPIAKPQLLLVSDGQVQRGQKPISELFFSNPVLLGLIIAAAIAIPIAIHNSDDDNDAS